MSMGDRLPTAQNPDPPAQGLYRDLPDIFKFIHYYLFLVQTNLQDSSTALDLRVTVLEENGGNNDNCSVAELEVRVEALEETAADHETRLVLAEENIECKYNATRVHIGNCSQKCLVNSM